MVQCFITYVNNLYKDKKVILSHILSLVVSFNSVNFEQVIIIDFILLKKKKKMFILNNYKIFNFSSAH